MTIKYVWVFSLLASAIIFVGCNMKLKTSQVKAAVNNEINDFLPDF